MLIYFIKFLFFIDVYFFLDIQTAYGINFSLFSQNHEDNVSLIIGTVFGNFPHLKLPHAFYRGSDGNTSHLRVDGEKLDPNSINKDKQELFGFGLHAGAVYKGRFDFWDMSWGFSGNFIHTPGNIGDLFYMTSVYENYGSMCFITKDTKIFKKISHNLGLGYDVTNYFENFYVHYFKNFYIYYGFNLKLTDNLFIYPSFYLPVYTDFGASSQGTSVSLTKKAQRYRQKIELQYNLGRTIFIGLGWIYENGRVEPYPNKKYERFGYHKSDSLIKEHQAMQLESHFLQFNIKRFY